MSREEDLHSYSMDFEKEEVEDELSALSSVDTATGAGGDYQSKSSTSKKNKIRHDSKKRTTDADADADSSIISSPSMSKSVSSDTAGGDSNRQVGKSKTQNKTIKQTNRPSTRDSETSIMDDDSYSSEFSLSSSHSNRVAATAAVPGSSTNRNTEKSLSEIEVVMQKLEEAHSKIENDSSLNSEVFGIGVDKNRQNSKEREDVAHTHRLSTRESASSFGGLDSLVADFGLFPLTDPVEPSTRKSEINEVDEIDELMRKLLEKGQAEPQHAVALGAIEEEDSLSSQSQAKSPTKEHVLRLLEDEINRVQAKTDGATNKPNDLPPSATADNSNQVVQIEELNQLKIELSDKSHQIIELQEEITRLNQEVNKSITSAKTAKQNATITLQEKEREHQKNILALEEEVNRLKTEIATIKLNNLIPPKPADNSNQQLLKDECNQLKRELSAKSQQVIELHREINRLKLEIKKKPESTTSVKSPLKNIVMPQEKENEYQKTIRGLQKQVRTLQKIMYHKDPSAVAIMSSSMNMDMLNLASTEKGQGDSINLRVESGSSQQLQVLENRIHELEAELAKADAKSNDRLKEFNVRFTNYRTKYEDRILELEKRLEESESRATAPDLLLLHESNSRYEKSQAEISQLKFEINRYRRELEIAAKCNAVGSSIQANTNAKSDAGTLSLAIKSFKAEMSEKDKEAIRLKKEIAELKKTNLHLKREREKYLTSTSSTNVNKSALNRAKSDLMGSPKKIPTQPRRASESLSKKPNSAGSVPKVDDNTIQMLQETLDSERTEFEEIITKKNRIIEEKENVILDLKHKIESVDAMPRKNSDVEFGLMEELRSRVATQNQVIQALKDHITSTNASQSELQTWKKEKSMLEFRIRGLSQELALAKSLEKPENEILAELSEKVDNLNSRYQYREKQLDLLLKFAAKGGPVTSSHLVNRFDLQETPLYDDKILLSPTTSMELLTDPSGI